MRTLYLLRHAKSDWPAGIPDIDRPLAERGRRDAPIAGSVIAGRGRHIDLVLVSPALRTRQTWALAAPALGMSEGDGCIEPAIYEAEPDDLLGLIGTVADDVHTLLVIGHNPGMEEVAARLAGAGDPESLRALREKFPTSAVAEIAWEGTWAAPAATRVTGFAIARG